MGTGGVKREDTYWMKENVWANSEVPIDTNGFSAAVEVWVPNEWESHERSHHLYLHSDADLLLKRPKWRKKRRNVNP